MAAISSTVKIKTPLPSDAFSVKEQFINKLVEKIKIIARDHLTRTTKCFSEHCLLDQGFYYGNEYFCLLKNFSFTRRIEWLKNKDAFFFGYFTTCKCFEQNIEKSDNHATMSGFKIKKNIKPSDALNLLEKSLTFLGCGEACQIACYQVLLETLGKEKFDILFDASSITPLTICFYYPNPLSPLLIKTQSFQEADLKKGTIAYFSNIPEYSSKHLFGDCSGYYTIVCSENTDKIKKFTAFGAPPEGISSEELKEILLSEFNKAPLTTETLSQDLAKKIISTRDSDKSKLIISLQNRTYSKEDFEKIIPSFEFRRVAFSLNLERIEILISSPIEMIRKTYDKWYIRGVYLNISPTQYL